MGSDSVDGGQLRDAVDKRTAVLTAVTEEPMQKPALVDSLDISRSTVDRAISELTEAGLVQRENSAYRATISGTLALRTYTNYVEQTDSIAAATTIVNAVADASRLDPVILRNADIHLADPTAPEGAFEPVVDELKQANSFRGFVQVVMSTYIALLYNQITKGTLSAEVIVEQQKRESLGALTHGREQLVEILQTDAFQVLETDQTLPYALWLIESDDRDVAGLAVHDAGGIVGLVINDDEEAVEWCRTEYECVRESAEPISPEVFNT